jgi:hypothetical protein
MLVGGNYLQKPVLEDFALLPVLFVEYTVSQLDGRKLGFPEPIRRTLPAVIAYAVLLVIADDIEGLLLQAAGGSVSGLGLLNLVTGAALGALIGWRSPRQAIWTILEASLAASILGAVVDLLLVSPQRFHQVHGGGSLAEVVLVSGAAFAASGVLGCLGLRVSRLLLHPAAAGEPAATLPPGTRRDAGAATEHDRTRMVLLGLSLAALIACVICAVAPWSHDPGPLPSGLYPLNRQVSSASGIVVTMVGVRIAPSGKTAFLLTYQNEGSGPETLACTGFTDPATVTPREGQAVQSAATYCSDHPDSGKTLAPGGVLHSYAIFTSDRDLSRPFSFGWQAGSLSGTVPRITLARHPAS